MLNILVLANEDWDEAHDGASEFGHEDVAEVIRTARRIQDVLARNPMVDCRLALIRSLSDLPGTVLARREDLVFNLVESLHRNATAEAAVAWWLESRRIGFTGSSSATLRGCLDKAWCMDALSRRGIPVPRTDVWTRHRRNRRFPLPALVKPVRTDASIGISSSSVVHTPEALEQQAGRIAEGFGGTALVQEYIEGREINVAFLGNRMLPPSEIDFTGFPVDRPRIVTYEAKWVEGSPEWNGTRSIRAALTRKEYRAVEQISRAAWQEMGLRDYGRVDLRLDDRGRPFVIEVNPNCDLDPEAGFSRSCFRAGLSYPEVISMIACQALQRSLGLHEGRR